MQRVTGSPPLQSGQVAEPGATCTWPGGGGPAGSEREPAEEDASDQGVGWKGLAVGERAFEKQFPEHPTSENE